MSLGKVAKVLSRRPMLSINHKKNPSETTQNYKPEKYLLLIS
jgi:hypothetical protein